VPAHSRRYRGGAANIFDRLGDEVARGGVEEGVFGAAVAGVRVDGYEPPTSLRSTVPLATARWSSEQPWAPT
jgi:hypothetical protein